jgi:hypothetical protein
LTFSNGSIYQGEFKDGKQQGQGNYYNKTNGDFYKGSWSNDYYDG